MPGHASLIAPPPPWRSTPGRASMSFIKIGLAAISSLIALTATASAGVRYNGFPKLGYSVVLPAPAAGKSSQLDARAERQNRTPGSAIAVSQGWDQLTRHLNRSMALRTAAILNAWISANSSLSTIIPPPPGGFWMGEASSSRVHPRRRRDHRARTSSSPSPRGRRQSPRPGQALPANREFLPVQ